MKLSSVHHVGLVVADVDAAVQWFTGSFNCEIISQSVTEANLKFENITLQIVLPSVVPPHIAFNKDDAETYGSLSKHSNGYEYAYISDPTGNIIEVVKT